MSRADSPQLAAACKGFWPLPDGRVWTEHGSIDAQTADWLSGMDYFASAEVHARHLAENYALDAEAESALRVEIDGLAEQGWLMTERALAQPVRKTHGSGIQTCAVLSCARPSGLARVLSDFGRPAHEAGRRILVSEDAAADTCPPGALGLDVHWLNREHRQRWITALSDQELRDCASWALLPIQDGLTTVGSSINAVTLASPDQGLALFDDDIGGPVGRAVQSEPRRWTMVGDGDPTLLLLYDSLDDAIEDTVVMDADPCSLLETALGRSVAEMMGQHSVKVAPGAPATAGIAIRQGGRVVSAMLGIVGDSGMASSQWYLGLDQDAGRRLDQAFRQRLFSRNVNRAAECHKLSQTAFFMNACTALDCSQDLPPFYPRGRNADGLFGALLKVIEPLAFRLYMPYVVAHRPVESRENSAEQLFAPIGPQSLVDLLRSSLGDWQAPILANSAKARMQACGLFIEAIGRLSPADFKDWVRQMRLSQLSSQARWLSRLLDTTPALRHKAIRASQEKLGEALRAVQTDDPKALFFGAHGAADCQRGFMQFGQLLQAWPELLQEARKRPLYGEDRRL